MGQFHFVGENDSDERSRAIIALLLIVCTFYHEGLRDSCKILGEWEQ